MVLDCRECNAIISGRRIAKKPGERVITGLVAWRDDHFGIAHALVWVEREQKTVNR